MLNISESLMMFRGATNRRYFTEVVQPFLYNKCGRDPEKVHELMLKELHDKRGFAGLMAQMFPKPKELRIKLRNIDIIPFGTAAGMDKNGDALALFGSVFGFQEPGTIVVNPREGNKKPRVVNDEKNLDVYNAQGFPSKGLEYFLNNISAYRKSGGKATVIANICGMPISETDAIKTAMNEIELIVTKLLPYVDGFVWNCFSPNTEALKMLRTPQVFYDTSQLMQRLAKDKIRLVKIGPYEPEEKNATFELVKRFLEGGGDGIVTTNTKMFPKEQLPDSVRDTWGYPSAGRSGAFLKNYRLGSVRELRMQFPDTVIVGVGGIYTPADAYATFEAGANMIEGYTPYTYYGAALVKELMNGVLKELKAHGYNNMHELQARSMHQ